LYFKIDFYFLFLIFYKLKMSEEIYSKSKEYQKKYYEKKKAEGLLEKLKENYDPEKRRKRYELEKDVKDLIVKQKEYNIRKKKEEDIKLIKNCIENDSDEKNKFMIHLIESGLFDKLTTKQKKEFFDSK
jgi:hypothetical protein